MSFRSKINAHENWTFMDDVDEFEFSLWLIPYKKEKLKKLKFIGMISPNFLIVFFN